MKELVKVRDDLQVISSDFQEKGRDTHDAISLSVFILAFLVISFIGLVHVFHQHENEEKQERINLLELQMESVVKAKDETDLSLEEANRSRATLQQALHKKEGEVEREQKRRERIEKELKETTNKLNARVSKQVGVD